MWGTELPTKDTNMKKKNVSMPPLKNIQKGKTTRNERTLSTLNLSRSKKTIELIEVS